jgi:hypothetical protein
MVKYLLKKGSKTRIKNREGNDPAEVANNYSHFQTAKIIWDFQESERHKSSEELIQMKELATKLFRKHDVLCIGRVDKENMMKCTSDLCFELDIPTSSIPQENIQAMTQKSGSNGTVSVMAYLGWFEEFVGREFVEEGEKTGDSARDS